MHRSISLFCVRCMSMSVTVAMLTKNAHWPLVLITRLKTPAHLVVHLENVTSVPFKCKIAGTVKTILYNGTGYQA